MKKRIFSLFLALLMLLAVAVTGCSDEKTDDESLTKAYKQEREDNRLT